MAGLEKAEIPYRPLMQTRHTYAALMLQKEPQSIGSRSRLDHRNLTMLIRHYWRWINPGELSQDVLDRIGYRDNSTPL